MAASEAADSVLRAKYLDWCSARLADQFLALSPDEIYELAQSQSRDRNPETDSTIPAWVADPPEPVISHSPVPNVVRDWTVFTSDPASFPGLVARVTEVLLQRLHLPSFEEWRDAYRSNPARFDHELLGLWREGA